MARLKNNNQSRVSFRAYSATITWAPGFNQAILRVGLLTGALALNIVDPNVREGDEVFIFLKADATGRIVTIGGANAAGGTVTLSANGETVLHLVASGVGTVVRYLSTTSLV